ncbi:hypothetical protein DFJ63DRAFT_333095 [Scheffersomyces coipomensis]|uniref:uncharacterized protein n=1 Tax=Scheffersomyces coipomensis TaxID=1788519 RepID=UPI00315D5E92
MSKLQSLLDLEYLIEFYQSLENGRIISTLDRNPIKNYLASLPFLKNLLHQPNEEEVIAIDKINQILDPDKIINDRKKVVLMWNRFMRFDVFEPVEYNAIELKLSIKTFSDYCDKFNFGDTGNINMAANNTSKAFKQMIFLCLMPQKLLQPSDPIKYPFVDSEDPNGELDNSSYNSIEGLSGIKLPNKTIHRPLRYDERDYDPEDEEEPRKLNKLSNFIGFFQPPPDLNINDMIHSTSELNMIEFKFDKNQYDHIVNGFYQLETQEPKNDHWAHNSIFYYNILNSIEGSMNTFGYKTIEEYPENFTLGKKQFRIYSDSHIRINPTRSIPIQISPILQLMYENFKNGNSWESRLPFINLYSQLFRGCISHDNYSGFLSDGMMILYIKYVVNEDEEVKWDNVGRYLYWNLPCQIYEVNSIMEFIDCIQDSAHTMNTKPIREVVTKFYSEVRYPLHRICEKYYSDLQITLENLEHSLQDGTSFEMGSNSGISSKYFDILNQIHCFYGPRWKPMALEHLLKIVQIECVLGGCKKFQYNAVVLKVKSFGKTYAIKIFDPIYSKSIKRQHFHFTETMRDCTTSFIKECCAYAILENSDFTPKILQVGTLTSDKNSMSRKISPEDPRINLKGFYIIMEYIDARQLSGIWRPEDALAQVGKVLKRVHDYGISHGDITGKNILVNYRCQYKRVYFIDFGCCKFSNIQTLFPNICTKDDRFKDAIEMDDAKLKLHWDEIMYLWKVLKTIHQSGISHGDIFGSNILINNKDDSKRMNQLQSLLELDYVVEFHQSLENGRIISTLDQNPIKNYHSSIPFLLNLLHQPNEDDIIVIDKINQILDPDHSINDRKKVLMWNRLMRFDVFEPLEYNVLELQDTVSQSEYEPRELDSSFDSIEGTSGFKLQNKMVNRPFISDENVGKVNRMYSKLNYLSDHLGFFQPPPELNINDMIHPVSKLNMIELKFHKNNSDHEFDSCFNLTTKVDKNTYSIYLKIFKKNILDIINSFLKEPEYQKIYDNFKNGSSWESRLLFVNLYSQLFRQCVALNSYSGFLSDGMMILYIKYDITEDTEVKWDHYGKYLYWNLPCQIYEVKSILEFINCIQDSAHTINHKPIKDAVTKFYNEDEAPINNICEKYYKELKINLESLEHSLEYGTFSVREESRSGISAKYFDMLKQIRCFYGTRWVPLTSYNLSEEYKAEKILGGVNIFRCNGVLLKVRVNEQTYMIKIFDPIYSRSMKRSKFHYVETVRDCIASFIKECCAFAVLQGQDFVPRIYQVGTLTNDNTKIEKIYTRNLEKINARGFYIMMEYVDGKQLSRFWILDQVQLDDPVEKVLKRIHACGVSLGDISGEDILIKAGGEYKTNPKVYFIALGFCKFSKLQTLFPSISSEDKDFDDSKTNDKVKVGKLLDEVYRDIDSSDD